MSSAAKMFLTRENEPGRRPRDVAMPGAGVGDGQKFLADNIVEGDLESVPGAEVLDGVELLDACMLPTPVSHSSLLADASGSAGRVGALSCKPS